MWWLQRYPCICYTQISLFPKLIASFSSYDYPTQYHHHNHLFSLLNEFPSSRCVTQQIHSQLVINGLLYQFPNIQLIYLFNALLRRYALGEFAYEAINLYKQAQKSPTLHLYFDSFTYSFLIKACANSTQQFTGTQLHALAVQLGFESHVYVQTALLNMYIDFGSVENATKLFDEMPDRNLVTWNVMITGLVKWGHLDAALALFRKMPRKNIVSWTGMIDGFTQMKNHVGAFNLFQEMMLVGGINPTEVTLLPILTSIAEFGDLKICQSIHCFVAQSGFNGSQIKNHLIDTYAKCGCIRSASMIFEKMSKNRTVVSWSSIISGFAMHGMAKEAEDLLRRMESSGIRPNRVTYLSVLNAYSHSGLVEEGLGFFRRMVDQGLVEPDAKHYGCVIDMMGRAGKLKEAEEIAMEIPKDVINVIIWRTLLGACSCHGNVEMAKRVSGKIHEMERKYGGDYALMSNVLTGRGKFDEAETVRRLMDKLHVLKTAGHSSV